MVSIQKWIVKKPFIDSLFKQNLFDMAEGSASSSTTTTTTTTTASSTSPIMDDILPQGEDQLTTNEVEDETPVKITSSNYTIGVEVDEDDDSDSDVELERKRKRKK